MATELLKIQPMWTTPFVVLVPGFEIKKRIENKKPFLNKVAALPSVLLYPPVLKK